MCSGRSARRRFAWCDATAAICRWWSHRPGWPPFARCPESLLRASPRRRMPIRTRRTRVPPCPVCARARRSSRRAWSGWAPTRSGPSRATAPVSPSRCSIWASAVGTCPWRRRRASCRRPRRPRRRALTPRTGSRDAMRTATSRTTASSWRRQCSTTRRRPTTSSSTTTRNRTSRRRSTGSFSGIPTSWCTATASSRGRSTARAMRRRRWTARRHRASRG